MARALRNADELLLPAVQATLAQLELQPEDAGAKRLAEGYAREIDGTPEDYRADVLKDLGPKLLSTLESLGATPAARARISKPSGGAKDDSPLARLRAGRSA